MKRFILYFVVALVIYFANNQLFAISNSNGFMFNSIDSLNTLYIPQPVVVEATDKGKSFEFKTDEIQIYSPKNCKTAQYLHAMLDNCCKNVKPLQIKDYNSNKNIDNSIIFVFTSDKKLKKEGYIIDVTPKNIVIQANDETGLFYAIQTFWQMIHKNYALLQYSLKEKETSFQTLIACQHIEDYPRFEYRGKHLDCARHFFDITFLKQYIDILAFHKINTFHWHLTDDQGWRIEIKAYPLLTEIGSKRKHTLVGHYSDNNPNSPNFDGLEYKGYYTQDEIRDLVQYAADRHITIIPEIEMPGHSVAALAAYPELSCREKPLDVECTWGVFEDVFCCKEETFVFLENVLKEVIDLFPSKYIHIGGDETPTNRWKECPNCKKVILQNNLKDASELQGYFTKKIEAFLNKHGKKIIGWDEILEKGVDTSVTIMSWQGEQGAINAARKGNDAIMAASAYLYFNFYQSVADTEPLSFGGFTPLKKVYLFEPISNTLNKEESKHILGMQACTWTEYIKDSNILLYNDLPRLSAMSERAWSKKEIRDYNNFITRLDNILAIYDDCNINYSKSHFAIKAKSKAVENGLEISLSSCLNNGEIYYTLNNQNISCNNIKYEKPFIISKDCTIKAIVCLNNKQYSPTFTANYHINKATGKKYIMQDINPQYAGENPFSLTDGLCGNRKSFDRWVGTLGKDYNVVIDLDKIQSISNISINFLNEPTSWIFLPKEVHFYISEDNKNWTEIIDVEQKEVYDNPKVFNYSVHCNKQAKFVKIKAISIGQCPENHPGKGYPAHTFADEIEVN